MNYYLLPLTLYQTTKFWTQITVIESICRTKINIPQIFGSVFDRVENVVGKGENAGDQHFSSSGS